MARKRNLVVRTWDKIPTVGQVAIVGVGTYYGVKLIKKFVNRVPTAPLPNGGYGIPVTGTDANGKPIVWTPDALVEDLYNAMSGLGTFTGTKDEVWTRLINLPTSDMITATYNKFNSKHGDGKSLTTWVDDEYYYDYFTGVKAATLAKLRGLNLL